MCVSDLNDCVMRIEAAAADEFGTIFAAAVERLGG
jgi:hypothetical protein